MKRFFDILISILGLLFSSIILIPAIIIVWLNDFHSPFYLAPRVGKNEKPFTMIKLRSMIINADKSGVDSTSNNDVRITKIGRLIRKYKLDELVQLWNVLKGDMSLVGPRPNVKRETDLYTKEEKKLLTVKPGITDFSSIVFSDEGEILKDYDDPDIAYNQLIRPGKSMLGIFYIENRSLIIDFEIILLTIIAIISRRIALQYVTSILSRLNANIELIEIAARKNCLIPLPPPGSKHIVLNREGKVE